MVRPSASSTVNESSVTAKPVAEAASLSTVKEVTPALQQPFLVRLDQVADPVNLVSAKAVASLQAHWLKPGLRFAVVVFDVDLRWHAIVPRVKEESERAAA
jgi:hypothetical protein